LASKFGVGFLQYCTVCTDGSRTGTGISLATTPRTSSQQQPRQQVQESIPLPRPQQQQQQQTTFYYIGVHDDISGRRMRSILTSGQPSVDGRNYDNSFQPSTSNDNNVDHRQRPSGHYQQLDPLVLETLRQPPTPSVYARLSPNATDASQTLDTTEPGGAGNTQNYEGLDPATLSESSASNHYSALTGTSQNLTVTSHDYLEVIPSSEDENDN